MFVGGSFREPYIETELLAYPCTVTEKKQGNKARSGGCGALRDRTLPASLF